LNLEKNSLIKNDLWNSVKNNVEMTIGKDNINQEVADLNNVRIEENKNIAEFENKGDNNGNQDKKANGWFYKPIGIRNIDNQDKKSTGWLKKTKTIDDHGKRSFYNKKVVKKKLKINIDDIEKEYLIRDGKVDGEINPDDEDQIKELHKELDLLLPRKLEEGKLRKHRLCTNFGWFGLGKTKSKSAVENLGVGTDCYFKVIKVYIICFLIIFSINIPLYYVYYNYKSDRKTNYYGDSLFKLTIGNIASSK